MIEVYKAIHSLEKVTGKKKSSADCFAGKDLVGIMLNLVGTKLNVPRLGTSCHKEVVWHVTVIAGVTQLQKAL